MLTSVKRIIQSGWIGFWRNGGLTIATCFIMIMTISQISFLFLFHQISQFLIAEIQEKADISVYFKEDSLEEDILEVKKEVSKISEVKEVKYVSKEEALENFVQKYKKNPVLMESLREVGENPLLASLNIKAWQASQYATITDFLKNSQFGNLIEKIDYYQRKSVIEKIFLITSGINTAGIVLSIVLALIAISVAFNQIRLSIYNSREEIKIMRLVGASNWFIWGPFLVQGLIAGSLAVLVTILITSGVSYFLGPKTEILYPGLNIFNYFINNFWTLLLIQLTAGIGLGVVSSLVAIKKYLKV